MTYIFRKTCYIMYFKVKFLVGFLFRIYTFREPNDIFLCLGKMIVRNKKNSWLRFFDKLEQQSILQFLEACNFPYPSNRNGYIIKKVHPNYLKVEHISISCHVMIISVKISTILQILLILVSLKYMHNSYHVWGIFISSKSFHVG